ncbi:hypothetical protein BDR26DRAFT_859788, partial [Obelidium mucronatum]
MIPFRQVFDKHDILACQKTSKEAFQFGGIFQILNHMNEFADFESNVFKKVVALLVYTAFVESRSSVSTSILFLVFFIFIFLVIVFIVFMDILFFGFFFFLLLIIIVLFTILFSGLSSARARSRRCPRFHKFHTFVINKDGNAMPNRSKCRWQLGPTQSFVFRKVKHQDFSHIAEVAGNVG